MKANDYMNIFRETAYVRMGGSAEELTCARYLQQQCEKMSLQATLEAFEVPMSRMESAKVYMDGEEIPCKGYLCCGNEADLEAPFYYLRSNDAYSLSLCKGKIVMVDGYLGYWMYQDLLENGAVGFITYDGNVNYADRDIDQRELRSYVHKGNRIPGVNINAKDAVALIEKGVTTARIVIRQEEYTGNSHNVVLDLPGTDPEYIVLTAHYDSTSLSQGAYDNMSGSAGLLGLAKIFKDLPHRRGLRFVWCGSEERGLLGAKAYVEQHKEELKNVVLNINLDMIGCIMGKFIACCTTEDALVQYLGYMANELGFPVKAYQDVYSSDSTPFADNGVPALSFARIAPSPTGTIHNSYDTAELMSGRQMEEDVVFIAAFTQRMADACRCPVSRTIPDNMKEKLDIYLTRKRDPKK